VVVVICNTHGRAGAVETCSHAAKQIREWERPDGRQLALPWGAPLFLCDACFNSLGFEQFVSLCSLPLEDAIRVKDGRWEAFDAAYHSIEGRRLFCVKCVEELKCKSSPTRSVSPSSR
jgi:hypothetical protein